MVLIYELRGNLNKALYIFFGTIFMYNEACK